MFQGDRLYVDLVEINPPLVVWLQLPIVFLARWLGIDPTTAFRVAVLVLIGLCLVLCVRLLRAVTPRPWDRDWVLVAMLAVLLGWTRAHFGEREHIALAAMLPYFIASAAAARGHPPESVIGLAVGAVASIGFGMKPHFLLVWLAVFAYVAWSRRGTRWTIGIENWVVLAVLLVYAVLVLTAAPEYLALVKRLGSTYDAFARKNPFDLVLHSVEAVCGIGALLAYGLVRPSLRFRELGDVLALATGAFLLAALVQGKGFSYHFYPVSACTLLLAAVALVGQEPSRMRSAGRAGVLALGGLLLLGVGSGLAWSLRQLWREDPLYLRQSQMARYMHERAGDGSILRLGYEDNFPLMDQAGGRWTMRFPNLWFVQAVYAEQLATSRRLEYRSPAHMPVAERWCFDAVVDDFVRKRPSLLMVIRPHPPGVTGSVTRLDYLAYLSQDPRFVTALQDYDFTGNVGGYFVFQRRL
jgi:hypothetical protein